MKNTAVINIVGLSASLIGAQTPFLQGYLQRAPLRFIAPALPALTCTAQANYLTGTTANEHGIVANGWYFADECEIKLWRQSNHLVTAKKIWEYARERDPAFTCANMFWWYNMYSSVDYSVTPRPQYLADGRKMPDCYTHPAALRDELQQALGTFPLFDFWGPRTSIRSSVWIAEASKITYQRYQPTLSLVYLPHLDYNLQRYGVAQHPKVQQDLQEIDKVVADLVRFYETQGVQVILLSEYGISPVHQPIFLNRLFREQGWLAIREERGTELLDAGASQVFAMADHQIAHIYLNDKRLLPQVRQLLAKTSGIEHILDDTTKAQYGLAHARAGDLVALADRDSWFAYYYWLDDRRAPDFAHIVDIHKKPGYDPVEMFANPKIPFLPIYVAWKLLRKKLGFRMLMDVIPLDATLVRGSHGRIPDDVREYPVFISAQNSTANDNTTIASTEVMQMILRHIFG